MAHSSYQSDIAFTIKLNVILSDLDFTLKAMLGCDDRGGIRKYVFYSRGVLNFQPIDSIEAFIVQFLENKKNKKCEILRECASH